MSRLLARFRLAELDAQHAALIRKILAESSVDERPVTPILHAMPNHGDWQRLRGIPAVGRGVAGAVRGTRPDVEALRRLEQQGW